MDGSSFLFVQFGFIVSCAWGEWILSWSELLLLSIKRFDNMFCKSSLRSSYKSSLNFLNRFLGMIKLSSWIEVLIFGNKGLIVLGTFGFFKGFINTDW